MTEKLAAVAGNKWVDRVLVMGAIMGAFMAGFSGRAGPAGLSLEEPVRLIVGVMIAFGCGFALVERVVGVETQCANTAAQVEALRKIILNLAIHDGVKIDPDMVLNPTADRPVEVSVERRPGHLVEQ